MSLDTTRTRLADGLITQADTLAHGRILCVSVADIGYAFPCPEGGTPVDLFKSQIPDAAFGFKYGYDSTGNHLLIERIVPDGQRRWVDPAQVAQYRKIGDTYFPLREHYGVVNNG